MIQTQKLSLTAAILININIMLGVGIFINTAKLAEHAGSLGFLSYAMVGMLMLPLILAIAELLRRHPTAGFYGFGTSEINPFIGFISTWSYFTSKLGSCAIMIHASVKYIQHLMPAIAHISPFIFDTVIIIFFILCNMLNMRTGSMIQKTFICFKVLPVLFVIICGTCFFDPSSLYASIPTCSEFYTTIPLVIYAIMGFEAACSLSNRIENPRRNAPLAVLISFSIVITLSLFYQFFFYAVLGQQLAGAEYHSVFQLFIDKLMPFSQFWRLKLLAIMQTGIAVSALGGAYGILFSNSWNLHTLAQHKHILMSSLFTKLNAHAIPYVCILAEGILIFLYLGISGGAQLPLQQLSALGCTITYTLSAFALVAAVWRDSSSIFLRIIAWLAVGSCSLLLASCVRSFILNGMIMLFVFIAILALGTIMYMVTKNDKHGTNQI